MSWSYEGTVTFVPLYVTHSEYSFLRPTSISGGYLGIIRGPFTSRFVADLSDLGLLKTQLTGLSDTRVFIPKAAFP